MEADMTNAKRTPKQTGTLEVHTHSFTSGQRVGGHYECNGHQTTWHTGSITHSHEGGNVAHSHEDMGPACYTIDKDEWYRSTGLRGGGRKKFTVKPSGEQFPITELEDWQKSFAVIICEPTAAKGESGYMGEGPGEALPLRVAYSHKIPFTVTEDR
jgi:hypothetical protein